MCVCMYVYMYMCIMYLYVCVCMHACVYMSGANRPICFAQYKRTCMQLSFINKCDSCVHRRTILVYCTSTYKYTKKRTYIHMQTHEPRTEKQNIPCTNTHSQVQSGVSKMQKSLHSRRSSLCFVRTKIRRKLRESYFGDSG